MRNASMPLEAAQSVPTMPKVSRPPRGRLSTSFTTGARTLATSPGRITVVQSGSSTTPEPQQQWYTVAAGDSLSKIAKRFYGDANQWRKIYDANREQIKNPDLIHPGQKLSIPPAAAKSV